MILEPISIATGGYVGVAEAGFCPLPLAIASDGYIRFETINRKTLGGGHGAVLFEPTVQEQDNTTEILMLIALYLHNE